VVCKSVTLAIVCVWLEAAAPISAKDHVTAAEPSKFFAVDPIVKALVVANLVAVAALPVHDAAVVALATADVMLAPVCV
jgi:hypothetical protein